MHLCVQGSVNAALLTADGARALTLSKDCTARVWDAATGACLHVLIGHSDGVVTAALSADGGTALTLAFDCSVRAWDLASGRCRAVMVPPGGKQVAAPSAIPRLRVPRVWGWSISLTCARDSASRQLPGNHRCQYTVRW